MMLLIVGILIFLGIHLLPTSPELRDAVRDRMGAGPYRAFFAIVSLVGFVVIALGFHKLQLNPGKNPILWSPPVWTRHIALALMLPAMIFLAASLIPSGIRTALKHPMLVAIKLWALAHLMANGDLASLLLFGSFLAYAVYDRISLKRRLGGEPPLSGAAVASPAINDVLVVIVGIALYAALLFGGHQWLIGVAPLASISG